MPAFAPGTPPAFAKGNGIEPWGTVSDASARLLLLIMDPATRMIAWEGRSGRGVGRQG